MLISACLFYWFRSLTLTIVVYYIHIFLVICQVLIIAILIGKKKIKLALIAFLIVVVFSLISWGLYPLYIVFTERFLGGDI